jgi:putative membrane protein
VRLVLFRRRVEDEGTRRSRLLAIAVRLTINAAALWLAARVVSGIEISGWGSLAGTAFIFGLVNALIKPVAHILGCPLTCLTMGLFALVINAAMLALTTWIADGIGLEVSIDGFWAALLGALLISVVSWALNLFVDRPFRGVLGR